MIGLNARARAQIAALRASYEALGRDAAVLNLMRQIEAAIAHLTAGTGRRLPSPMSFPELARSGTGWIKAGPYWIVHTTTPPEIIAVYHEASDFPRHYTQT